MFEIIKKIGRFALCTFAGLAISLLSYAQDGDGASTKSGAAGLSTDAAVIEKGKAIFSANCQQCHAVHEQVVGPKLANVYERQSVAWLINFIKYPQKTIESGDAYAVGLYKQYKQFMPNHDFLKDDEIVAILSWVQDETIKGPAVAATTPEGGATATTQTQGGANAGLFTAIIGVLVIVLLAVLTVMAILVTTLSKYINQREGATLSEEDKEYLGQRFSLMQIVTSQAFIGIVAVIFVIFAGKATLDGLFSIGVQQGYAPDQPIKFSHKLHAGYYDIQCQYCHTGVEKDKHANIPSANICMNCHNAIKTTSPEIQKIYQAIENDQPIQWVRIHNLPDLSYFNHAQHVKVGGIECETCHGDIKNMEVVQQHSLLTMGWCIDCHRKTEIKSDNKYYEKLSVIHATSSKEPMRVENIGGLECSKCHY